VIGTATISSTGATAVFKTSWSLEVIEAAASVFASAVLPPPAFKSEPGAITFYTFKPQQEQTLPEIDVTEGLTGVEMTFDFKTASPILSCADGKIFAQAQIA
jgi:hypothetical protein